MNGIGLYQETAVATQSQGRLIVILYEGAIRFLTQAVDDIRQRDYAAKGHHIQRAADIIYELNTVLNMEQGGPIAQNLRSLYNFMLQQLNDANLHKDIRKIQEVIDLLKDLNESWRTIAG
jgi:flagellar protein FliS